MRDFTPTDKDKRIEELEKQVADLEWQLQEVAKDNDIYQKENAELKNIICANEYYQNGYKQGKLEESRKREVEIFEIQGEVELRDVRIYDLNKKVNELEAENAELKEANRVLLEVKDIDDEIDWKALVDKAELIKENVELKARLQKKINTTTVSDYPYSALKLEEAKEIIALGLRVCETSSIEYMNWYQKRAEQFLNDNDCPDTLCEDCTKEDCGVKKLGLVEN